MREEKCFFTTWHLPIYKKPSLQKEKCSNFKHWTTKKWQNLQGKFQSHFRERTLWESKIPISAMVSEGVSKLGKASIQFVIPGTKVNNTYYRNKVLPQLLPEIEQLSNGDYIFQQDGACSHTSKVTLAYLEEHCCKFLKPDS